jgi:hypothetical protein
LDPFCLIDKDNTILLGAFASLLITGGKF